MNAPVAPPAVPADVFALAERLRPALLRASRRLRAEAQRAGASAIDAQILGTIKKNPGIGLSGLAEREQMTKPSMSAHLERLRAADLVAFAPASGADRRRKGLALTPAGARALDAIRRRRNDWLAARLASLDPAARAALDAATGPLAQLAGEAR